MHSIKRCMHVCWLVLHGWCLFFSLLHKHLHSHHSKALGFMGKWCTMSKVSHQHGRPIKRCMFYRKTRCLLCLINWFFCSCEARYIHPAAPYIFTQLSIQLLWCFLSTFFPLPLCVIYTVLFSSEIWMQKHSLYLGEHRLLWNIEAGKDKRRSLLNLYHPLELLLIKAPVLDSRLVGSCCQFVTREVVWNFRHEEKLKEGGSLRAFPVSFLNFLSFNWS